MRWACQIYTALRLLPLTVPAPVSQIGILVRKPTLPDAAATDPTRALQIRVIHAMLPKCIVLGRMGRAARGRSAIISSCVIGALGLPGLRCSSEYELESSCSGLSQGTCEMAYVEGCCWNGNPTKSTRCNSPDGIYCTWQNGACSNGTECMTSLILV